jgi:hypothetical protein
MLAEFVQNFIETERRLTQFEREALKANLQKLNIRELLVLLVTRWLTESAE